MIAPAAVALDKARPDTGAASRLRSNRWVGVIVLAAVGALLAVRRAESPYADTDILWGIRSGLDVLSGRGLPHTDQYSWTVAGHEWIPNSWAWNVLLAICYRLAGYAGIAALGIAVMIGVGSLLGVALRRVGATTAWGALLAQILLGLLALFLYPRAQLTDYVAVLAIPLLLPRLLAPKRRIRLSAAASIVAIQIAWMNLHTAAILGPVIVAAAGAGLLMRARSWHGTGRISLLVLACAGACLATPYGWKPITHFAEVRSASVGLISEWRPAGIGSIEQFLALLAILIGLGATYFAWKSRRFDTVALLVVFAGLTGSALRFAPMLVLVAIPPLASAAGRIPARPAFVTRICWLALATLAALCVANAHHMADPGAANTSPSLVSALPANCRLVNDMTVGGAVILQRPDVTVSIDSRNDLYGRTLEETSLSVLGDARIGQQYLIANNVDCVLAPRGAPLVRELEHNAAWRSLGHDAYRVLLARTR